MTGRAVVNEFAKMRRLRVVPVVVVLVAGVVAMSCFTLTAPGVLDSADAPSAHPWRWLLGGLALAVPLVSPLLLAVLASRQVDIEHQANGWLLSRTSGLTPGALCRAKFAATRPLWASVAAIGRLVGITAPFPTGQWVGYTASVVVVNLVVLALHLLLSACVGNQLVGLGAGVLGVFVAVSGTGLPPALAHLLPPWGYYGPATPVDVREGGVVALDPPHLSVLALGIAGGAVFVLVTRLLDRGEA